MNFFIWFVISKVCQTLVYTAVYTQHSKIPLTRSTEVINWNLSAEYITCSLVTRSVSCAAYWDFGQIKEKLNFFHNDDVIFVVLDNISIGYDDILFTTVISVICWLCYTNSESTNSIQWPYQLLVEFIVSDSTVPSALLQRFCKTMELSFYLQKCVSYFHLHLLLLSCVQNCPL